MMDIPEAATIENNSMGVGNGAASDDRPFATEEKLRNTIDRRLRQLMLNERNTPQRLHQALCYSLNAPGKRIRPTLTLLTADHFGATISTALDPACAIEMVHTASLIMDDLPAMDGSEMRRGQPTLHRAFGEDIAILAAVALLSRAFSVIGHAQTLSDRVRLKLIEILSNAVGTNGLVGGQVIDLLERSRNMSQGRLEQLNECKTAALFVGATETGAVIAEARDRSVLAARNFGSRLGLAFQIADDLIDDPTFAGQTGKDTGKDLDKPTIVSVLGRRGAKQLLDEHVAEARQALHEMNPGTSALSKFFELKLARLLNAAQLQ